jgi:thiopeptide-type bacteriocin biosynthesis protein
MAKEPAKEHHALPELADSGFFVLRTPLLPVDDLLQWSDSAEASRLCAANAEPAAIETAWAEEVGRLRTRLREMLDRPEVVQALYVASPSLRGGIEHWKRDPDGKKGLQAERALVRYFARMCVRCTPFGVFSGCSVGAIDRQGAGTDLELEPRSRYRTSSRLDFDYLFALSAALRRDPALGLELRYRPNTSLRRIGHGWHYIESRQATSGRSHHLVKVEDDPYLRAALARAEEGATVQEVAQAVALQEGDFQPTEEEARDYVFELVQNEVLVPSLDPLVTGEPPLDDLIRQLEALPAGARFADPLREARQAMQDLDARGLGCAPEDYEAVAARLESLPAAIDPARLFQVDMFKPAARARLGQLVIDELVRGVDVLCRLGKAAEEPPELKSFREALTERYDRAMVPLLEALDEETGVGFGRSAAADASPLLRGLRLGPDAAGWGAPFDAQGLLMSRWLGPRASEQSEICLDPADLPSRPLTSRGLPQAFCITATIVASTAAAVEAGDFQLSMKGGAGPSGARLLGRFCHGDREIERLVRHHLEQEEAHDPEAVYAEVVYTPEGRVGNVLCRPVLRGYEIPYLGRSGAPRDRQLPVSDLLVGVEGGRIVLFSQRLRRPVVPRLSNAHGYVNPRLAAVYRFLCHLQSQHASLPGFWWGAALNSQEYLPRIRVGRLILSTARWRLSQAEINELTRPSRSGRFVAVQGLRRRRGLPRWILLEENDNTLPVDLDNPLSVDAFVHVLKRVTAATVSEMFPAPDTQCVTGPEGRFCHEINIPLVLAPRKVSKPEAPRAPASASVALARSAASAPRTVSPAGEWLYLKVYSGWTVLDEILTDVVPSIVESAGGALSRWFFIRYGDPHDHLRIRFCGEPEQLRRDVLPLVSKGFDPLLASGRVWKIQLDTYNREIERYGGNEATLVAEDIFCADSEAVLEILRAAPGDEGMDLRWRIALWGVDMLLSDFGLDLEARRREVARWRDGFQGPFQIGKAARQSLGDRFRAERRRLEAMFWGTAEPGPVLRRARRALERRSRLVAGAVGRLHALAETGQLHAEFPELLPSYVHMHVNRLIRSSGTSHEPVLYDFLHRLYEGRLASGTGAVLAAAAGSGGAEEV